ncbi:hypothetical protein BGZ68_008818 [Mortierella alpina]|nr:hypothetical protein BGZ68_008818 [Mortierella alpina]
MSASYTTTIFDLPPVVDTVCRYLHRKDYYNASLVNKAFHDGCRRYIWRKLVFKNDENSDSLSVEYQMTLRANSHWIQQLTVNKTYIPLIYLTRVCDKLQFLECDLEHESSQYTRALKMFMASNSGISNLTLKSRDDDPQNNDEGRPLNIEGIKEVFAVLPRSLKNISVNTAGRYGALDLFLLLSSLPPSVESISYHESFKQGREMIDPLGFLRGLNLSWPVVYPNMRELEFGELGQYNLTSVIIPLLRKCPLLERLSLPIISGHELPSIAEVLRDSCPKLNALTIVGYLEEDELLPVVDALPGLASLDLPIDTPTLTVFVSQIIAKWSSTLTSLTFGAGAILESSDIQLLLTSCPRLLTFWMIPHGGTEKPWTVSTYYSPLLLSDLAQSEWTCLGLEVLNIMFHDERFERDTLEQHLEQEERTRELIKKAYTQLGKLKRLKTLYLAWGRPFREGEVDDESLTIHKPGPLVHMDFSMASGLALLKGMESLRDLSLDDMARISVGSEELEWIQQTWPDIGISGLDKSNTDWLQRRRRKPARKRPSLKKATSPSTSIFDLPPVVETICRHLHRWDYANASLINKTFHNACRPYLWRRLVFEGTHNNQAISKEHQRALLANSHWIQDLTHETSKYNSSLAKLLTLNPKIRNLTFKALDDDPQNYDMDGPQDIDGITQVVTALPHLTALQHLSVETTGRFGCMDLALFLTNLPPSVVCFNLTDLHLEDSGIEEPFDLSDEQELCWPNVYPNIVDLHFDGFDQYSLTSLIVPLLDRCPLLERLTLSGLQRFDLQFIAEALRDSCPNMRSVTICGNVEEEDLLMIVDAIPALRSLDLPIDVSTTAAFVPQLVGKWSNSLTSVILGVGARIQSLDIQLLLTSCPLLEDLWMCPYALKKRPWIVESYYSPLKLSDLAQSEWACYGLVSLNIVFHDERVEQETLEQHLEQEERTRELIKKAYTQLGKLKKLRTLQLGWGRPFREGEGGDSFAIHKPGPVVHMDFSMASGLALMKGMDSLEKLFLDDMARISVGNEELEWIKQTWPDVEISGLDKGNTD